MLLTKMDSALRSLAVAVATLGLCLLFLNAVATVADVVGRSLFDTPIDRLSDVSLLIYIVAAACCVPAATARRRHITIRPFEGRLSPRGHAAIEAGASLLLLAVWVLLAWQIWRHAAGLQRVGQTLSQLPIHVAPFWFFVAVALSFNALLEALNLAKLSGQALGAVPTEAAAGDGEGADATML